MNNKYNAANPFYDVHLFTKEDLRRAMISWRTKMWLWILPTRIQIHEGIAFHYKHWGGKYYLMKIEKDYSRLKIE